MSATPSRNRLLPIVGLVLVVGFLTTNVLSYLISANALRTAIIEHELPLTGNNVLAEVEKDLVRPILVSSLMANDTFVQDWLKNGEADVGAITRYLQRIRNEYNAFTAFLVSRDTQAYYHFSAPPRHVSQDDPLDAWFFRMVDSRFPYEINVDHNRQQGGALTVFINYRVVDHDGQMIGLTGIGLDFSSVRNIVSRYREQFNRNIYFVDASGRIVVSADADTPVGATLQSSEGLKDIAGRILSEERGDYSFERHGVTILLSQRNIADLGWRVLVEQNEAAALRPLRVGFLTNIAIGIVLIASVLLLVVAAFRRHIEGVRQIAFVDHLTGLGNRQQFERDLEAARTGLDTRLASLVIVKLDRFADVNRRYGRAVGDAVLVRLARLIAEAAAGGQICRYEGASFGVLWHGDGEAAGRFARRLIKAIAAEALTDPDDGARLSASAGVAELRTGEGMGELIDRAEAVLNRVRANGGNGVATA
jgi:diguanylate cyclase (GGDEF)-like protein